MVVLAGYLLTWLLVKFDHRDHSGTQTTAQAKALRRKGRWGILCVLAPLREKFKASTSDGERNQATKRDTFLSGFLSLFLLLDVGEGCLGVGQLFVPAVIAAVLDQPGRGVQVLAR